MRPNYSETSPPPGDAIFGDHDSDGTRVVQVIMAVVHSKGIAMVLKTKVARCLSR